MAVMLDRELCLVIRVGKFDGWSRLFIKKEATTEVLHFDEL